MSNLPQVSTRTLLVLDENNLKSAIQFTGERVKDILNGSPLVNHKPGWGNSIPRFNLEKYSYNFSSPEDNGRLNMSTLDDVLPKGSKIRLSITVKHTKNGAGVKTYEDAVEFSKSANFADFKEYSIKHFGVSGGNKKQILNSISKLSAVNPVLNKSKTNSVGEKVEVGSEEESILTQIHKELVEIRKKFDVEYKLVPVYNYRFSKHPDLEQDQKETSQLQVKEEEISEDTTAVDNSAQASVDIESLEDDFDNWE